MFRAKPLAVLGCLALYAVLNGAAARPLPIASQEEIDALSEQTYVRLCYWADGHLLCNRYDGYAAAAFGQAAAEDSGDLGYHGAPGVYLDFSRPQRHRPNHDD